MSTDLPALFWKVLSQVGDPHLKIDEQAVRVITQLLTPLNTYLLNDPSSAQTVARNLGGELGMHALREVNRVLNNRKPIQLASPGAVIIEYLLAEILEMSGILVRERDRYGTIVSFDIYKAIFLDIELKKHFPVPQFPYLGRGGQQNNLAARFSTNYTEPDFLLGLNDYLQTFVKNISQTPEPQINNYLGGIGISPTGDLVWKRNTYIEAIFSRIQMAIQQYARGQQLNFYDLLAILSQLR